MINKKTFTYLEALFAVVVWGANFVATKDVVGEISPVTIIWLRFGMGFLILGAATAWRKQFALPQKSEWAYLALLGFIGITFHQWLQATGLITAAATTTAWIVATIPIFTAILGWLVLREKLGWLAIVGIVLATFGVLLIVSKGNLSALAAGNFGTPG
ncbi:MAG TPA: EamA/RhaT family transporter, partial [Anaerolineae bacterium]|nr:EamA/RhaT family transporter [Anaerolineae bacterium]